MALTLTGVDRTPAQTWNWLKTNDCELKVPTPPAADPAAEVPAAARRIACGAGAAATQWLDAAATQRRCVVVPAGSTGERVAVDLDCSLGSVAQTSVFVRPGAEAHVDVVVADGLGNAPRQADEREHAEANEDVARAADLPRPAEDAPATSGHALRIHAEAGSRVHVTLLVAATASEQYLDSLGIIADDRAEVTVRQYVIGAAIGSVGPEQLAYLADRGLTAKEAEALIRRAIVDDAANTLPGHAPAAVISWAREALGAETAAEIADALELGQDANHEGTTPGEA